MKRFVSRVLKFLSPIIILIVIPLFFYLNRDVYSDFGNRSNYSWKYLFQQLGDLSTKKLLVSPVEYNSFIFGSSRSCSVYACYLQKKIPDSRFFHYANWNETIGGIYRKLFILDSLGYNIDNVIIYIDSDCSFRDDGKCRPADHFLLTGVGRVNSVKNHFFSFFSNFDVDKFNILVGITVEGNVFPNWESDLLTNDPNHICSDSVINHYGEIRKGENFLNKIDSLKKSGFLEKRPEKQTFHEPQISDLEVGFLSGIKEIMKKENTNYYVIITPLYDQIKFNSSDIKILRDCFGDRLYDFSGKNEITENIQNYPDKAHFQNYVSKNILDSIVK